VSRNDDPGRVPLATIVREWGRIGCIGFGGPPAHIKLLRQLCVERQGWLDARQFEDAIAVCNLLPGPASTQLAIYCAWRLRGRAGALAGGAAFISPGLVVILALSVLFLGKSPPLWVLGAGAGAGAAVPAVAIQAGSSLAGPSWSRRKRTLRWLAYLIAGAAAAATIGVWLVLVLLGCGLIELTAQLAIARRDGTTLPTIMAAPMLAAGALGSGVLLSVAWVAVKVGALSYGGGFVIVPLMQADAVSHYHWMTGPQFLNAVALGQITPGPVVQTVAVVGYAAAGLIGGILASVVAFSPSFAFVLLGAHRFGQLRSDPRARGFLDGAGPAAIGAIFGSAIPLARALTHPWQYAVLCAALLVLFVLRRGVVLTLLCAGAVGVVIALAVGPALRLGAGRFQLRGLRWTPQLRVTVSPGLSTMRLSPVTKALGGQVIGSIATAFRCRPPCSVSLVNTWSQGQSAPAHSETCDPPARRCAQARPSFSRIRPVSAWSRTELPIRRGRRKSHTAPSRSWAGPAGMPRSSTGSHCVAGSASSQSSTGDDPAGDGPALR